MGPLNKLQDLPPILQKKVVHLEHMQSFYFNQTSKHFSKNSFSVNFIFYGLYGIKTEFREWGTFYLLFANSFAT